MFKDIDIWSKGEVVRYLMHLVDQKQIRPCINMGLEYGHASAYYPRCSKEWASRKNAHNVATDITAYSGPSSYWWPVCPPDCLYFSLSDNFQLTASRDQFDEGILSINENSEESKRLETGNQEKREPLVHPEKVTLYWLIKNVDWRFWITCATIIGATFCAGIQSSRLSFVREIFGLPSYQVEQPKEANHQIDQTKNTSVQN